MKSMDEKSMNPYILQLRAKTSSLSKRVVLTDGTDIRILSAARYLLHNSSLHPIVIGDTEAIRARAQEVEIADQIDIYDPARDERQPELVALLGRCYAGRGKEVPEQAVLERTASDPTFCGALLVRAGLADGLVGGATMPTATVIRAGIQVVGLDPLHPVVSGAFVMLLPERLQAGQDALIFADCAVIPDPTVQQLAAITINTARLTHTLIGQDPSIAMLSFSSYGSATHPAVTKVQEALRLVRESNPELRIDGEMQVDAALVPAISASKAPGNSIQGQANVLIFPTLDAGNIGYKLVQRICGANALGVILSGLARPVNDLSRGCSADDVVNMVAVTALQSAEATADVTR